MFLPEDATSTPGIEELMRKTQRIMCSAPSVPLVTGASFAGLQSSAKCWVDPARSPRSRWECAPAFSPRSAPRGASRSRCAPDGVSYMIGNAYGPLVRRIDVVRREAASQVVAPGCTMSGNASGWRSCAPLPPKDVARCDPACLHCRRRMLLSHRSCVSIVLRRSGRWRMRCFARSMRYGFVKSAVCGTAETARGIG